MQKTQPMYVLRQKYHIDEVEMKSQDSMIADMFCQCPPKWNTNTKRKELVYLVSRLTGNELKTLAPINVYICPWDYTCTTWLM